eukprot:Em0014g330a
MGQRPMIMGQGDQDHGHDHGSRRQDHGHKETMIMGQGGKIMATRRPRSWVKETKIMAMIMGQVCKILYKILGKTVWNLAAIIHSILILAMILVMFLVKIFSLGSAIEDVVAQFDEAEKSQASKSAKNRVPLNILQDAFHQHAEELKAAMESKTWKELDEDLRKQLTSSVEALLIFKKYPIPNSTALTKRIKDFYTTRRTTVIIKSDPEKKKKRRLALKRSRLTYAARDKAVKTAILSGELNVDDEEGIDRIRSSVQLVPISEARVLSDEEDERTAFEQQRLENLSRARAVRAARREREE